MSTDLRMRALAAALAVTPLGLVACAGTLDDVDAYRAALGEGGGDVATAEVSCPDVVATVFGPQCASCHGATSPQGNLDLASPDIFGRYAGRAAASGTRPLLDVNGDPGESVLWLKLQASPPYGGSMPPASRLDDATVACVGTWIRDQARARP